MYEPSSLPRVFTSSGYGVPYSLGNIAWGATLLFICGQSGPAGVTGFFWHATYTNRLANQIVEVDIFMAKCT